MRIHMKVSTVSRAKMTVRTPAPASPETTRHACSNNESAQGMKGPIVLSTAREASSSCSSPVMGGGPETVRNARPSPMAGDLQNQEEKEPAHSLGFL